MKKWPIYSDFSILSHNSGNFGQNEKQVLFSEGATSGTEPNRFPESSSVMCHNVVYQWSGSEHCPTIPLQAHCVQGGPRTQDRKWETFLGGGIKYFAL